MRTSTINLIAILTIVAVALAAGSVSAGGFSFGGGGGKGGGKGGGGSFKVSLGGGNHNHQNHKHHSHKHHGHHHHKYCHYPVKKYYEPTYVYDQCYHPYYRFCYVHPGDTWYTIAKRCYGQTHLWKHIATYNDLGLSSSVLVPGQQLQLPVVNANGTLAASNAPAPTGFAPQSASFGSQGAPIGPQAQAMAPQAAAATQPINPAAASIQPMNTAAPAAPAANIRSISEEPKRPIVTIGSMLALDGESLGTEEGTVRLRISGLALPVEVLEWNDSSVKIQLPTLDLSEAISAELEVLRADGRLASNSAIELSPAATRLALGN